MSTPSSADKAEVHGQSSLIQAAFAIEIDDPAQIRAQNEGFCSPVRLSCCVLVCVIDLRH
jgi:hypothetical protein